MKTSLSRQALLTFSVVCSLLVSACTSTSHPEQKSKLGVISNDAVMEALIEKSGPIRLKTIRNADWQVPLSGLLNLKDPQSVSAGIKDQDEAIQIYSYLIWHPKHGYFLIDSGVSEKLVKNPEELGLSYIMRKGMGIDKMRLVESTKQTLSSLPEKLQGVFLTHLHLDHISGLPEISNDTPIYAGPGETTERYWLNVFVQSSTDALLRGKAALQTWQFPATADAQLEGVIDIFGDASVFAIKTPGHTAGSTAYLVRTENGPILITGDTSHTKWGWKHCVAPGDYTRNQEANLQSLKQLKALVQRHPTISVQLGHQH